MRVPEYQERLHSFLLWFDEGAAKMRVAKDMDVGNCHSLYTSTLAIIC